LQLKVRATTISLTDKGGDKSDKTLTKALGRPVPDKQNVVESQIKLTGFL